MYASNRTYNTDSSVDNISGGYVPRDTRSSYDVKQQKTGSIGLDRYLRIDRWSHNYSCKDKVYRRNPCDSTERHRGAAVPCR